VIAANLGDRRGDPAPPAAGRLGREGHRPAGRRSADRVTGRQGLLADRTLPPPDSDLAQSLSKSPYLFEWLGLDEQAAEMEIERGLLARIVQ
jgi:hypothetical protein